MPPFEKSISHWLAPRDRGELVLGGALAESVDGAVLLFRGDSPAAAAEADPYGSTSIARFALAAMKMLAMSIPHSDKDTIERGQGLGSMDVPLDCK